MSEKYRFVVELHKCNYDGQLFLTVPTSNDGGIRISEHKPVTSEHIRTFRVSITPEDLAAACEYARPRAEWK